MPLEFFTDSILRGPTIGSMLMCLAAALVGVIVFLRKQSLIGEALSHAAYPGVMVGTILAGLFSFEAADEIGLAFFILLGAFATAILGMNAINWLEHRYQIKSDSALCFILSTFFGIGLTLASNIQFTFTSLYKQVQVYLYGQAATMGDIHIYIYGLLSLCIVIIIFSLKKELQVITFHREYASSLGINVSRINAIIFMLVTVAVVVGIRSVGVVLMSAMLIAPVVAARQFTNHFGFMLVLAGFFGLVSGFAGNYLSVQLVNNLNTETNARLTLPTGPMIVLFATILCVLSLMLAPKRGILLRIVRIAKFRYQCIRENLLKTIWLLKKLNPMSFDEMTQYQGANRFYLRLILSRLAREGWVQKLHDNCYQLTKDGAQKAARIVRLHRLWEVYLVDYLGTGKERVHRSAEEMEHIITPELENELTLLLKNPHIDLNSQEIHQQK